MDVFKHTFLNISKTKYNIFKSPLKKSLKIPTIRKLKGHNIDREKTFKFRGTYFDECLNWKNNIDEKCKCKKISKIVPILGRLKHNLPPRAR